MVRCRKSDVELVQSVLEDATKEYSAKLRSEVPKFKDREIRCKVSIDEANFLPELNLSEPGLQSWY